MSADTKTRILDTAEVLFAERGYSATSLRDITAEAGVNLAAVNYHFGSKEALLAAVFERRVVPVNDERLRLLDLVEAEAGKGPLDAEPVVRACLVPAFQTGAESGLPEPKFMQLVGRMHSETNEQFRKAFFSLFAEVAQRFTAALARALPEVAPEEVTWRLHFLIGSWRTRWSGGSAVMASWPHRRRTTTICSRHWHASPSPGCAPAGRHLSQGVSRNLHIGFTRAPQLIRKDH